VIWTHSRSLAGQQGISSPVSLLAGLLAGLFSHLSESQAAVTVFFLAFFFFFIPEMVIEDVERACLFPLDACNAMMAGFRDAMTRGHIH
jgi:hypothetical protein